MDSEISGLTSAEVGIRLEKYGLNEIEATQGKHPLRVLIDQFKNVMVYLLLLNQLAEP